MANVILKNISGSSLSLNLLADTPAATLSTNQTINLLQYVSLSEATKSLQAGELKQAVIQQKISLIKNSIGFIKKSDANISLAINTLTATFRILPTGTSFSYNQQITDGNGNLVIQTHASTGDTIAITLTSGKSAFYSIYYNNSVLSYEDLSATSSTVFSDLLRVPVCIMWYDANTGTGWLFDQRQESYTDWSENLLLDKVQQIKYKSGLQLTNKTNCQAQFTPGTIIQNTSEINITNSLQTLNPLNARILYRKDSVANKKGYDWSVFDPTSLADILYYRTGNNVGYNSYGENGWSVVAAFANYYVPYWVVATNCSSTPIMVIVGQDQYSTLTEAQYQSRFDKLALENFIIRGFKPLYRLIIKNAASPIVVDTTDLRNEKLVADYISAGGVVVSGGGGETTLHQNLTDLQGGAWGEYYHLSSAQHTWLTDGVTAGRWGVTKGGTGINACAAGDIIYANAKDQFTVLSKGSIGQVLTMSEGQLPIWQTSSGGGGTTIHNNLIEMQGGTDAQYYHLTEAQHTWLTDGVTAGYWGTAKGGTGLTAYTFGDIIYASAANTLSTIHSGSTGQVLTMSAGKIPAWETLPVTAHNNLNEMQGGTTGEFYHLTSAQHTWLTAGVSAGYWGTAKGGTGLTTYAAGDIIYASAANTLAKLPKGTDGQILALASGLPSWINGNTLTGYTKPGATDYGAVALGVEAGASNALGMVAIGYQAAKSCTAYDVGDVVIGYGAGSSNISIYRCTLIGATAGVNIKTNSAGTAHSITAVGYGAISNTNGAGNATTIAYGSTALGVYAGRGKFFTNSIYIGVNSGRYTSDTPGTGGVTSAEGDCNIFIGHETGATDWTPPVSNSIAIGKRARFSKSSVAVIGAPDVPISLGINMLDPSARMHLPAGTATVGTAPLKFTSGTALTTPEDGVVEYQNSHLYFTVGSTRHQLDQQFTGFSTSTVGSDKYMYVENGDTNKPFIKFNDTANQWEGSNDGTSAFAIGGYSASTSYGIPKALSNGKIHIGWIPTGITNDSVCIGNDSRLIATTPTNATTGQAIVSTGTTVSLRGNVGRWWNSGVTPTSTPVSSSVVAVSGLTIKVGEPVRFLMKTSLASGIWASCPSPSNVTLTGLTGSIVDYRGCLYFKNIVVSDPTYRMDIFSDELCTNKIAYTTDFIANVTTQYTNVAISAYNGSGITGTCSIDCTDETRVPNSISPVCFMRTGICTAYNGTNLTFAGQSVGTTANTVLEVWLGAPELVDQFMISIPGTYARLTTEQAFKDMLSDVRYWNGPNATLVMVKASQGVAQTGVTPPKISPKINTNLLLADGVALSLSTADTVVATTVNLEQAYSTLKFGDRIELKVQAGSTADARDLSGVFIIVKD